MNWRFGIDLGLAEPRRVASGIRVPALFLTSAGDDYVRPEMTRALYSEVRAPKRLRIFPSGGHGQALQMQPDAYRAEVRGFLHDLVGMEVRP